MLLILDYGLRGAPYVPDLEAGLRARGCVVVKPRLSLTRQQFHATSCAFATALALAQAGDPVVLVGWSDPTYPFSVTEEHALRLLVARYQAALYRVEGPGDDCVELNDLALRMWRQSPSWTHDLSQNYTGYSTPKVLLVGDRHNHRHRRYAWPFHGNRASSFTLHSALTFAKFPDLALVNVNDPGAEYMLWRLLGPQARNDPLVVALGNNALRGLRQFGYGADARVDHPAYVKRFRGNNVLEYASELRLAIDYPPLVT